MVRRVGVSFDIIWRVFVATMCFAFTVTLLRAQAPGASQSHFVMIGLFLTKFFQLQAQGPGPSHVPAAASDPFALMSMDMSGAQPSPSAPLKRVMLAASAAQVFD